MTDPNRVYLAPPCCSDGDLGRVWCEDDVWPCADCPAPENATPAAYRLVGGPDDAEIDRLRAGFEFALTWLDGLPARPSRDDKEAARRVLHAALHGKVEILKSEDGE